MRLKVFVTSLEVFSKRAFDLRKIPLRSIEKFLCVTVSTPKAGRQHGWG